MALNVGISLGAYVLQNIINKTSPTIDGILMAVGSGIISGLTFNQPLVGSIIISLGIELAGYTWENIEKIMEKLFGKR